MHNLESLDYEEERGSERIAGGTTSFPAMEIPMAALLFKESQSAQGLLSPCREPGDRELPSQTTPVKPQGLFNQRWACLKRNLHALRGATPPR